MKRVNNEQSVRGKDDTNEAKKKAKIISPNFIQLDIPQAEVLYYSSIFSPEICFKYYQELSSLPYWTRPTFKIFGRPAKAARQTCSFGSYPNKVYKYSGTTAGVDSIEYPPSIKEIKEKIEDILNTQFNFVLLNWYKDGQDSIGDHCDNEKGLVKFGVIACVSLGAKRTFMEQLNNIGNIQFPKKNQLEKEESV
ncbi:15414_t:CDS:2 [Funneliformis geosporum]|uniref:18174_t:CDS:1 n=1 Tax=Funneliformis geosporum TaxID=1117311 RepID=A0A9W4WW93_9GLOM|nr:18174_t:CDS:2 [Funneliformis geosporum]CAI2188490.1 15414_t:CDS:2 [Funneliformis geosporum]